MWKLSLMNKLLGYVIFCTLLSAWLIVYSETTQGFSVEEAAEKVRIAAENYKTEMNYDDSSCNIGWQSTSLWGLMYAIMVQEWGFKPWTAGYRTNNWGSLHSSLWERRPVSLHCIDGTCNRPQYETVWDGLHEKAHLIAADKYRYKCSFGYNALYAYVVGPNADPNAIHPTWRTNQQHVTVLYWRMKDNAAWFDGNNTESSGAKFNWGLSDVKGGATTHPSLPTVETETHTWFRTDWTKMDYVQIDTWDGEMITRIPCPETWCKIFKWNWH